MSIDVLAEHILSIKALAEKIKPPRSVQTVRNWSITGVISCTGKRIFLDTVRIGGIRCTSYEAYERFVAELTALDVENEREPEKRPEIGLFGGIGLPRETPRTGRKGR